MLRQRGAELRHESVTVKYTTVKKKKKKRQVVDIAGDGMRNPTQRPVLVSPVLLDDEVPLPGQMVVLVVVSKLGLDVVGAASQNPFRSLV